MFDFIYSAFVVVFIVVAIALVVEIYNSDGYQTQVTSYYQSKNIAQRERTERIAIRSEAWTERFNLFLTFGAGALGLLGISFIAYKLTNSYTRRQHEYNLKLLELNYGLLANQQQIVQKQAPTVTNNYYNQINVNNPTPVTTDLFNRFLLSDKYSINEAEVDGTYFLVDNQTNQRKLIEVKD